MDDRLAAWNEQTGRTIAFKNIDVARDFGAVIALLGSLIPDTIIHFGEQRAAPYSMKSDQHKNYTVTNNVNATHHLLNAMVELDLDAHLVQRVAARAHALRLRQLVAGREFWDVLGELLASPALLARLRLGVRDRRVERLALGGLEGLGDERLVEEPALLGSGVLGRGRATLLARGAEGQPAIGCDVVAELLVLLAKLGELGVAFSKKRYRLFDRRHASLSARRHC